MDEPTDHSKDPNAVALGRKGGLKGGKARAAAMTPAERKEAARAAAAVRWTGQKTPKETHAGIWHIGDVEIACAVLDNKMRVYSRTGVNDAFGAAKKSGNLSAPVGVPQPPAFLSSVSLRPFFSPELVEAITVPVAYKTRQGQTAFGYEARVLPEICEAIQKAARAGALKHNQLKLAEAADILYKGLARTGTIAIIDEATGFQAERDKSELQLILSKYIAEELMPWTKLFPDSFYQEMFRLWKWPYSPITAARPQCVGPLTNEIVYKRLPPGVLEELEVRNPTTATGRRKHKHHQLLTRDGKDDGVAHLERHLIGVIALMRAASNKTDFKKSLARVYPRPGEQTAFDFDTED